MQLPHLPALRLGRAYKSLDQTEVKDHRSGEARAAVSMANAGILRKDLKKVAEAQAALRKHTVAELIDVSARAGEQFVNGTLPFGDKGHSFRRR